MLDSTPLPRLRGCLAICDAFQNLFGLERFLVGKKVKRVKPKTKVESLWSRPFMWKRHEVQALVKKVPRWTEVLVEPQIFENKTFPLGIVLRRLNGHISMQFKMI